MEWIFIGFFGVLGLAVAAIIGLAAYQAFLGKGKDEPNKGPQMGRQHSAMENHTPIHHHNGPNDGGGV